VAVGSESFIAAIELDLKLKQPGRRLVEIDGDFALREDPSELYRVSEVKNAR